jgi:hypothetical protein
MLVSVCSERSNGVSEGNYWCWCANTLSIHSEHCSVGRVTSTKRTRLHEDAMEVITTASSLSMTPRRSCAPHVTTPPTCCGVSSGRRFLCRYVHGGRGASARTTGNT